MEHIPCTAKPIQHFSLPPCSVMDERNTLSCVSGTLTLDFMSVIHQIVFRSIFNLYSAHISNCIPLRNVSLLKVFFGSFSPPCNSKKIYKFFLHVVCYVGYTTRVWWYVRRLYDNSTVGCPFTQTSCIFY